MTLAWTVLLGVMLLTDGEEAVENAELSSRIAAEADAGNVRQSAKEEEKVKAKITSRRSDFDRKAGVVMFDGNVVVTYSKDFTMCADRLFMFLAASNDVSRVVAIGHVAITNEMRVGLCDMATYRRKRSEVEMFSEGPERFCSIDEHSGSQSSVRGTRIKFWLDSEQIEVENSQISSERQQDGGVL